MDRLVAAGFAATGVSVARARSKAASLAHQFALDGMSASDITSHHVMELVRELDTNSLNPERISKLLAEGQMNPRDLQVAMKLHRMPELYRDYYRLPVEQKAKVMEAATPQERALLNAYSKRELDTTRLLPQQREEYREQMSK